MKKALSLILAVIVLMTMGIPLSAESRPENHWYWDSGSVIELGNESTASQNEELADLDDYFTLHTPSPIKNIVWTADESDAFIYYEEFQKFDFNPDYQTDIQFGKLLPKGYQDWNEFFEKAPCQGTDSKGNKQYQATVTITLENSDTMDIDLSFWFTKILSIEADFETDLTDASISKDGSLLKIYIYDPLPGADNPNNYTFHWEITKGKDYAGFAKTQGQGSDKTTSGDYRKDTEKDCWVHEMRVYGYKAGMVTIECAIEAKNDTDPNHRSLCRVVGIPVCIEKATPDDIKDELEELNQGKDVVIELPAGKGLDNDLLKAIKDNAANSNPVVTLKSENDPMELSFEFHAKNVNENIEKPFNMYYEATEDVQTGSKWLMFAYSGDAPADNMKIRFKAPGNLKSYTLSFYNEETGELEDSQTATVDEDGYLTYYIEHFSTYVVYPANETPPNIKPQPSGGNGGGSGRGGSSSGSSSSHSTPLLKGSVLKDVTANTATAKMISVAEASSAASKAAAQAKTAGKASGSVRFVNSPALPKAILETVQKTSVETGMPLTVYADTVMNNAVSARLYINPADATLPGEIKTGVTVGDTVVEAHFNKYFTNRLKCIRFAQQGPFGMDVGAAIKLDLTGMDSSKLVLYSYDMTSNTYTMLPNQAYYIDLGGYLHFTTSVGGSLIISEGVLA